MPILTFFILMTSGFYFLLKIVDDIMIEKTIEMLSRGTLDFRHIVLSVKYLILK